MPETIEIFVHSENLPEIKLIRVPKSGSLHDILEAARGEGLPVAADHSDAVVLLENNDQEQDLDQSLEELGVGHHHRIRCHRRQIHVSVNKQLVVFHRHEATGAQIKQAAINQKVSLQMDFTLFLVKSATQLTPIGDEEVVVLRDHEQFRATAPDDNS